MNNNNLSILILKLIIILNAVKLGWNVKKINNKNIIITKKINKLNVFDYDTEKMVKMICSNTK